MSNSLPVFKFSKRQRTTFTQPQLDILKEAFSNNQYPDNLRRDQLAIRTNLTSSKIQVWFQNQRAKFRKQQSVPRSVTTSYRPYSTDVQPVRSPVEQIYTQSYSEKYNNLATSQQTHLNVNSHHNHNHSHHPHHHNQNYMNQNRQNHHDKPIHTLPQNAQHHQNHNHMLPTQQQSHHQSILTTNQTPNLTSHLHNHQQHHYTTSQAFINNNTNINNLNQPLTHCQLDQQQQYCTTSGGIANNTSNISISNINDLMTANHNSHQIQQTSHDTSPANNYLF